MRRDMRLVQRRRVENRVRAINAARHAGAVNDIDPTSSVKGPATTSSPIRRMAQ